MAKVQAWGAGGSASASTIAAAPSSNLTAGNAIIAVVANHASAIQTVSSISGGGGSSWAKAVAQTGGTTRDIEIWYSTGVTGGSAPTITVTFSAATFAAVTFVEVSGLSSTPLDKTATDTSSGSPGDAGTTTALTAANEFVIAGWNVLGAGPTGITYSWSSALTSQTNETEQQNTGSNKVNLLTSDGISGSSGVTETLTITYTTGTNWDGCTATFLAASGANQSGFFGLMS